MNSSNNVDLRSCAYGSYTDFTDLIDLSVSRLPTPTWLIRCQRARHEARASSGPVSLEATRSLCIIYQSMKQVPNAS